MTAAAPTLNLRWRLTAIEGASRASVDRPYALRATQPSTPVPLPTLPPPHPPPSISSVQLSRRLDPSNAACRRRAWMKAAPAPIFISLGGGNKLTDSDTDRWPLPASHVRVITPARVCSFPRRAASGWNAGRERGGGGASLNIHLQSIIYHAGPSLLHRTHPVMHYRRGGSCWDRGTLA